MEMCMDGAPDKRGYTVKEAAVYLGCKVITVRRLIQRGFLKPMRILRILIIPKEQLDALLDGNTDLLLNGVSSAHGL